MLQGTATDATATLDLVDWGGVSELKEVENGETYRVTDIKAAYDSQRDAPLAARREHH